MKRKLFFIFGALLTGCSSPTPYIAANGLGEDGYAETQVDANVFRVSFHGNGKTPADYAEDMTLLRSAEVTKEHGFSYFAIVTGVSRTDGAESVGVTNSLATAHTYGEQNSAISASGFGSAFGASFSSSKPSTTNMIICYQERPNIAGGYVYSADFLIKSMYVKYQIISEKDKKRIRIEVARKKELNEAELRQMFLDDSKK